jgi:hypothetical protein
MCFAAGNEPGRGEAQSRVLVNSITDVPVQDQETDGHQVSRCEVQEIKSSRVPTQVSGPRNPPTLAYQLQVQPRAHTVYVYEVELSLRSAIRQAMK